MKLKHLMFSLAAISAMAAGAQNQGYQDGIEYFKADQLDNAKEILTKTLNNPETDRAEALYYLGAIALDEGNVDAARKNFEEGIQLDPKNGLNYVGLGAIDLKNGNAKAASDNFKAATKAQNKAFVNVAIARAYYNADPVGYAKEYDKYMDAAVKKDKKDPSIYVMRGDELRDQAVAAGEDNPEAIGKAAAQYKQAIHFDPKNPEAYVKYSRMFAKVNPQYAIDELIELNNIAPNSAMAQRELAERYYDSDKWTLAAEQYGKYIANPNSFKKDKERYVVLLFFGENYDKSLELTREILAADPNSLQMKRMLFLNLDKKGETQAAKEAAEAFFATHLPEGVKFTANDYTTYAGILHELGDVEGEIQAMGNAVAVNPEKIELLKDLSSANSQAGGNAYSAGDVEAANKYYVAALDAFLKFIEADDYVTQDLVDLASRYQNVASTSPEESEERANAIAGAMATIDKVIERVPDNFIPRRNKARMSVVANGNKPSAETVELYQAMIDLLDQDPENKTKRKSTYIEAYNQMAKYYLSEDVRDLDSAVVCYEKYFELDPENTALAEYIVKLKGDAEKAAKASKK